MTWKDSYDDEDEAGGLIAEDPVSSEYSRLLVVGNDLAKLLTDAKRKAFIDKELMPLWKLWSDRVKLFVAAVEAREKGD